MTIGIDISRANRFPRSGVEWYAYNLIQQFYLLDQQSDFLLYTPDKLAADLKPTSANYQERILGWPVKKFWTLGRMSWEMIAHKPDILFVPSHTFPLIGAGKNFITWHDVGYDRYPENYTRWELASLRKGIKLTKKIATKIISVSEFTKNEMVRLYQIDPEIIEVVYLGCDHQIWRPISLEVISQTLTRYNLTLPYFIFLGRLSLKKNVVGLIKIYNRFRNKFKQPFNLILVGNETPFSQEINSEIKASPYREEIKKFGWLPTDELPVLLAGSQGLIFPSIYEGFGLPALEAMACGCPVIASNSSSLPEIVSQAGLYAETHDIDGFANQMIKIITETDLRQQLINQGLERAKQFTWRRCAEQTLEIIKYTD